MGVNVTGGSPRRRIEGPEVQLPMSVSSSPRAASTEDGPASMPVSAVEVSAAARLARFPGPLQEALAEVALAAIDTDLDDKSALHFWADILGTSVDNDAVKRLMVATRGVVDAVNLHILEGRARRQVQALTQQIGARLEPLSSGEDDR